MLSDFTYILHRKQWENEKKGNADGGKIENQDAQRISKKDVGAAMKRVMNEKGS